MSSLSTPRIIQRPHGVTVSALVPASVAKGEWVAWCFCKKTPMNELEYGYYCTTALNCFQSCKYRPILVSDIHTSFHHLCSIWWNDGKDGLNCSVSGLRWWLFGLEMLSPLLLLHDSTLHSTIWLAIPPLFFVKAHGLGYASLLAHFAVQSRFTQSLLLIVFAV